MKIQNKKLIKLLGTLDILDSEKITEQNPKSEEDITFTIERFDAKEEYRILEDSVDDESVELLLEAEQLKTLKSIQRMLKFFTILAIIGLVGALLIILMN